MQTMHFAQSPGKVFSPNRLSDEFIFSWLSNAEDLLSPVGSMLFSPKDRELMAQLKEIFAPEGLGANPEFLQVVTELLPYMAHPTNRDDRASKLNCDSDAALIRAGRENEVEGVYSPIEIALFLAMGSPAAKVNTMRGASEAFSMLTQRNAIRDVTTKSVQERTVRWSITCRVVMDGQEKIVTTPYCAGRMIARAMVLSLAGFLTKDVKSKLRSISLLTGGAIYDRERLGKTYKNTRKIMSNTEAIDLSKDCELEIPSSNTKVSVSVTDPSSIIGLHCFSSLNPVDPNRLTEELRCSLTDNLDFQTIVGIDKDSVTECYEEIRPSHKILAAIRNRSVLRRVRAGEGRPNWNKDACLNLPLERFAGTSAEKNASRTTLRALTVLSDTINKIGLDPESYPYSEYIYVLNWGESFDVTMVACFAVMMRIEIIIKVGKSEVFFCKKPSADGSYTYSILNDLTQELFSSEKFLDSLRTFLISINKPRGERLVLISGGLAQSAIPPVETWMYATNCVLNTVKFSAQQAEESDRNPNYDWLTVRYAYSDFLLPDMCERCCDGVVSVCSGVAKMESSLELDTSSDQDRPLPSCPSCVETHRLAERFEQFLESSSVALVKPRYSYAHNCHLAYEYDVFLYSSLEDAIVRTNLCVSSVISSDVWRMTSTSDTTLVSVLTGKKDASKLSVAIRDYYANNASQRGKLLQSREIKGRVLLAKIGDCKDLRNVDLSTVFHVDKISDSNGDEDAANNLI